MPKGQCRCGGVRYRLKPPVTYTGREVRCLTVPQERFALKAGGELLEQCGPWQLCGRCGTTTFQTTEESVSALACTIDWPAQNVDDLHTQASYGNYLNVKRLIRRGMPLEARSGRWTPLAYAASNAKVYACRLLLKNGAQLESALGPAAFGREPGTAKVLRLLLRHGADRQRLFYETVEGGRVRDVRAVSDSTVDVNLRDEDGQTPLYLATYNSPAMIGYLLKRGADINQLNTDELDPLSRCACLGMVRYLRALLAGGPSMENLEKALAEACAYGQFECVELLLEAGASVNQEDYTPLMAASRQGSLVLVNRLLELGADPRAKDSEGKTAADYAQIYGPDLLAGLRPKFLSKQEGRLRHKWTTNAVGEPALKLRKNGFVRVWTNCHAAIVERLRDA